MYICMYLSMYVCMYACIYVCMYACLSVCLYVCTYVRMYVSARDWEVADRPAGLGFGRGSFGFPCRPTHQSRAFHYNEATGLMHFQALDLPHLRAGTRKQAPWGAKERDLI